jgi:hypothetical protein
MRPRLARCLTRPPARCARSLLMEPMTRMAFTPTLPTVTLTPAVIVPPRCTAVLSDKAATTPTQRDRHLQCIAERSRVDWQNVSGYNSRAKVEAAIGRWKQVIGDGRPSTRGRVRSRMDECRVTEVNVAVDVLNRMLELGRPSYVRIV